MANGSKLGNGPEADRNNRPRLNMQNVGSNIGNGNASARRRAMARANQANKMTLPPRQNTQPSINTDRNYDGDSQRLVPRTGVPGTYDGPPTADSEVSMSPMAREVRDQEVAASRGNIREQTEGLANPSPSISRGGFGVNRDDVKAASSIIRGGLGGGRQRLKDLEEKAGFYKDEAVAAGKKEIKAQAKSYIKRRLMQSQLLWVGGPIAAILGTVFALILLSTLAGPLQFIHLARSLNDFHMSVQEAQTGYMALKLARNIPYAVDGQREKTRMGTLGNIYANHITDMMESNGYKTRYEGGAFKGWVVEPGKLSSTDYPGLQSNKPEVVQKYFNDRGWRSSVSGGKVSVEPSGRFLDYYKNFSMLRTIMRDVGVKRMVPLQAHFFKARLGWTGNPMKKWINDKDNKILSDVEKKLKFLKQQRAYTRGAAKVSSPAVSARQNDPDKPPSDEGPNETRDLMAERDAALSALDEGDTSKINEFRDSIAGRFTALGLAGLAVLCFMQSLAHDYDILVELNIVEPQERMGMQALSWGAANERGTSDVVAEDANGQMADLYYDKKTGTTAMDARSIQYENGQPQSGPDIPDYAKPDPDGNAFTRFFAAVPGLDAICSTTGQAVLFLASVVVLGPINAALQFAGALASGPAINALTDMLMQQLLANQVPGDAAGALRGGYMDNGVFLAANQVGLNSGGVPLEAADSLLYATANREANTEKFQQQNLAYRLFDAEDPQSLFSRVLDQQAPNPGDNLSRVATGIPNIGRNFGATLARPFLKLVNAAAPYDRGRPITAIPFNVMTSNIPTVENPWANANMVADILDANTASGATGADNYITRAKTCHGKSIAKVPALVKPGAAPAPPGEMQYATLPPDNEAMPTDKTVRDPANKCKEDYGKPDANWPRIQMWLKAEHTWNAWVCGNNLNSADPIVKEACITIGQEPNPNATGGGAPNTGVSAGSNCPAGKFPASISNANNIKWKVTLPALSVPPPPGTSANGGAPEVKEPAYSQFCDPKYFALNDAGNGIVFTVFHGGSSSKTSSNPRSELRETVGGNPEGTWNAGSGIHTMEVQGYVTHLTKVKPEVVIAQVHDQNDDTSVWRVEGNKDGPDGTSTTAKLWITKGNETNPDGCEVPGFQLNTPYTLKYVITNGNYEYFFNGTKVNCIYSNGGQSYFKAGNYLQSNPSSAPGEQTTEYSQVVITSLKITHQ